MASGERRAVVTGAARGIGQAVTERLLREGLAELDAQRKKAVPLGRGASAAECAGLIWPDEAAHMTGRAIDVTGGLVNW